MHYWTALFLSTAITIFADNTLYEELKTNSAPQIQDGERYNFSLEQTPPLFKGTLLETVEHDRISESLEKKFHPINSDADQDYLPRYINVNEEMPYPYRKLIEDTFYLQLLMLTSIGFLATLPDEITKWDSEELEKQSLEERWKENVSTPPIWDNDDMLINYIGHPVSGAWYYTMARNDGMSISESAAFSTLMSTFFWEYGYEAFAEIPSIQDLIITPLFGSILGEGMFVLEGKLDQRGGVLFGSKLLGNISYFFLDPIGNISHGVRDKLKHFNIDIDVTMTIQTYPQARTVRQFPVLDPKEDSIRAREREIGFIITFS